MGYFILVYDVGVQRVNEVRKYLRRSMNWIQNSVFEGELTESELMRITDGLKHMIDISHDSVIIYKVQQEKLLQRFVLGTERSSISNII